MNRLLKSILCFLALCVPLTSLAQQVGQTMYIHTISRSVPAGGGPAFREFIDEVIKPLYAADVRSGRLDGWYLWRTHYKSESSEYDFVIARSSTNLANLQVSWADGLEEQVRRVHQMTLGEFNNRAALAPSSVVKTELWVQSPLTLRQPNGRPGQWGNVVYYRNNEGNNQARSLLLRNVVAPFQQGRIDRGISAGWGYFSRRFPFDNAGSYDVAEISYYNDFDEVLGAGIGGEIWEGIRPDNSNLGDNMRRLGETREFLKRELWELIDYVETPQ